MTDEPKVCDKCERKFVTVKMLARAVHSGCTRTAQKHDLDNCPASEYFLMDARMLWKHMDKQAEGNT